MVVIFLFLVVFGWRIILMSFMVCSSMKVSSVGSRRGHPVRGRDDDREAGVPRPTPSVRALGSVAAPALSQTRFVAFEGPQSAGVYEVWRRLVASFQIGLQLGPTLSAAGWWLWKVRLAQPAADEEQE
jgi:hypothetical protein